MLAIDTSSVVTSVAVHDGSGVVADASHRAPNRHAEILTPAVSAVVHEAGATMRDVTSIAVGVGPGPFTGLRVGLMTARALGHALGVDVLGVVSLDSVAAQVRRGCVVVTDARRREVYTASYDDSARRGAGPEVVAPADLGDRLRAVGYAGAVVGPGVALYPDAFAELDVVADVDASAAEIARLAVAGSTVPSTAPLYLRRPDATPPGARKPALT